MSKTSWQTRKLQMKGDLENHLKALWFFLNNGWIPPDFSTRSIKTSSIWHEVLPGIFLGYALIAGRIWKEDILIADLEELEKLDASEIHPRTLNAKEVLISKERRIHFVSSIWYSKIVRKRLRIPSTHSKAGTICKEGRSQRRASRRIGRVSTDRTYRWRWSSCRLLVDSKWLHLSSSHWTTCTTPCAERRRNVPYSTLIQWCYLVYSYWSGRHAWKAYWWLLECRFMQAFVRLLERIYKVHYWKRTPLTKRVHVVPGIGKGSNDYQTILCMVRSLVENW